MCYCLVCWLCLRRDVNQDAKLDFLYSDNINHFFRFVREVGLPEVSCYPFYVSFVSELCVIGLHIRTH
jgi:hypothetical protein